MGLQLLATLLPEILANSGKKVEAPFLFTVTVNNNTPSNPNLLVWHPVWFGTKGTAQVGESTLVCSPRRYDTAAAVVMKIRARDPQAGALLQAAADGLLRPPYDDICTSRTGRDDLLLRTATCTSGCRALHWAAGAGQVAVVTYLLEERPPRQEEEEDDDGKTGSQANNGRWTPLFAVDDPAVGNSQGRTALHYACRNGHLDVVRLLVERFGANADARAKHGVTPLQLAVWQGHLAIAQYLVVQTAPTKDCSTPQEWMVNPHQTNDFSCGLVHWVGLAPPTTPVVDLARWMDQSLALDWRAVQKQGHNALHKAAWGGHLSLCRYYHEELGLWDDQADGAGNYAVDLARMAQHKDGGALVHYLQRVASRETYEACRLLGVSQQVHERTVTSIPKAFKRQVRSCHPDRKGERQKRSQLGADDFIEEEKRLVEHFQALTLAYRHLMACVTNDEDSDKLLVNRMCHTLPLLLTVDGSTGQGLGDTEDDDCFAARLLQVVQQNRRQGLDLSNLVKKWKQVWPQVEFPARKASLSLQQWLRQEVSHVVSIRTDEQGALRLYQLQDTGN